MKKNLGTPNQKASYSRIGMEIGRLQDEETPSIARSLAIFRGAHEMTAIKVAQILEAQTNFNMGKTVEIREVEQFKIEQLEIETVSENRIAKKVAALIQIPAQA